MTRKSIPISYYLITGLTGMALSMTFFGWFRQFGLLFGFQMTSVVITLTAWFLVMAIASHFSGRLSVKFLKPLKAVIVFLSIAALFLLMQSLILRGITSMYNHVIELHNPGSFAAAIMHFLLALLFFLIPVGLIAGSFPLYVTSYIRNLSQSGTYVSITIVSLTTGIILSLPAIPSMIAIWGIKSLYTGAAFLLIVICIFLTVINRKIDLGNFSLSKLNVYERTKTAIRFKKKKAVPDVSSKLTRAMLYGFVFQTMIFSSMLIVSIRILLNYTTLQPFFFFCSAFSVILISLSLGAYLYNKIAERPENKYLTLATLQIISGFAALLSYIAISMTGKVLYKLANTADSLTGSLSNELVVFAIILVPASLLYGMSFPLAGKIHPKRIQQMGNTYGQLGKLALFSITLSVVTTPFIIIPLIGLHAGFFFLSLMMVFSGIYLVSRDSRLIRVFRLGYASVVFVLFIITAGMFRVFKDTGEQKDVLRKVEGSSATFSAMKQSDQSLSVFMNTSYLTGTRKESLKEQILSASIPKAINKKINTALVIEFGTGITARVLDDYGLAEIQIAEIFPEMIRLSSDVFSDYNNDVMTSSNVNISVQDARSYLLRSGKQFDLITTGNDAIYRLPGLNSIEFADICFKHLSPEGIACLVIPMKGLSESEFKSLCMSWYRIFNHTSLWYISTDHILLIASKKNVTIDYCALIKDFEVLNKGNILGSIEITDPQSLMAHLVMNENEMGEMLKHSTENTDYKPDFTYHHFNPDNQDSIVQTVFRHLPENEEMLIFSDSCSMIQPTITSQIRKLNESLWQVALPSFSKPKQPADYSSEQPD